MVVPERPVEPEYSDNPAVYLGQRLRYMEELDLYARRLEVLLKGCQV